MAFTTAIFTKVTTARVIMFLARQPTVGQGLLIHEVSRSHTTTHHTRYDSSGRVISSSQRPLPDNTQHSQQTNIHAPGGIRTHDLSRRAAADLRFRPRGHRDRLVSQSVRKTILKSQQSDPELKHKPGTPITLIRTPISQPGH